MRDGPDEEILSGAYSWVPQVSAWLGDQLLAEDVPVIDGTLSVDGGQQVPERLTLSVPDRDGGFSWVPDSTGHPLARYGQYLDVAIAVTAAVSGESWTVRLGRYQIQDWTHDDVAFRVDVECVGLLQRAADARFTTPKVPRAGETLSGVFARLAPDGVPVDIDGTLADRAVPTSFQWDEDRIGALYDIAEAWPARIRMDDQGTCRVLPPLPDLPDPVLSFRDGERGTVVSAPTQDSRDGVYNVVVARSSATDDPARAPAQGEARVQAGPMSPASYGEVVRFWSSPLATTTAQLNAAAATLLADSIRPARQRVVTCPPDPRVELDDAAEVLSGARTVTPSPTTRIDGGPAGATQTLTYDGGAAGDLSSYVIGGEAGTSFGSTTELTWQNRDIGWVVGYDLPLRSGPMTVRVGVTS